MLPQTLAIATWLLYIDAVFGILRWLDGVDIQGAWRSTGPVGSFLALAAPIACAAGGFLMANGRRWGWYAAVGASFAPFALRLAWKLLQQSSISWEWVLNGGGWIGFAFEAALVALLLHPMSRGYARTWLR